MAYSAYENFNPTLIIGIGATQAYFTLRETYLYPRIDGGYEVRSYHHYNLSQDADVAYEKALEASHNMGIELYANPEKMAQEMREIARATAEQRAEREAAVQRQEEQWEAQREAIEAAKRDLIMSGKYAFGQYYEKNFEDARVGYITWLVNNVDTFEVGSIIRLTAEQVAIKCAHLVLPKPHPSLHTGTVKKRETFKATVIRCIPFDGYYGRTYFTTLVDAATNACLLVKSGAFSANEGEVLEFKATVSEHGDYKGQAQTVLQRVAVI